jgi:anaerobic dimethyl sulfoxide reductase subunit C (anchor subunit)
MNVREWALPVYTILMQLAVGSLGILLAIRLVFSRRYGDAEVERLMRNPVAVILLTVAAAMLGSFFHLSRPYMAFVAIFNFTSSWLSREILFTVAMFFCIASLWYLQANVENHMRLKTWLGWGGFCFGLGAVFCMSRIYILPTQASWDNAYTTTSFYLSMVVLGSAASLIMLIVDLRFSEIQAVHTVGARPEIIRQAMKGIAAVAVAGAITIPLLYVYLFNCLQHGDVTAQASLQLYLGLYRPLLIFRMVMLLTGTTWMVISVVQTQRNKISLTQLGVHSYMACLFLLIGEILGRFLFYATHIRLGI